MFILYAAIALLSIWCIWTVYSQVNRRRLRKQRDLMLRIAAEVGRGERPQGDLEQYGLKVGPYVAGGQVEKDLLQELGLDVDDPAAPDHVRAHKLCEANRPLILKSETCGCFHCVSILSSKSIMKWDESGQSALCPKCGVDALIPGDAGYHVTEAFLKRMRRTWFEKSGD